MASLNVAEWTPDQVADWMSGLGPTVASYIPSLRKQKLDGVKLLTLRCDDLEYLGMHIIGHQELLLEAVEQLRNFQYEARRECVQQLALRVAGAARALAGALRAERAERLDTQALADVASTVRAVKPLVVWLERWPSGALAERKAALLQLALEAATCAQRERFAFEPARAVAAAAHAAALAADYIVQRAADPRVLQPASLERVRLRQGARPLGFCVVPSFCGHHQLAALRFGSPAHASGLVHEHDEIVQVGARCVVGWGGAEVAKACTSAAKAAHGELALRLRRRAPPAPPPRRRREFEATLCYAPPVARAPPGSAASSDSELSPPASPTQPLAPRLYPPAPPRPPHRRHTISGGSPPAKRAHLAIEHFWQQLRARGSRGDTENDDTLYRRDKALSCSTGLELSPRPRTCLGVARGRLDKSQSTPAYGQPPPDGADADDSLRAQPIPESPTTPTDSPTILVHSAEKADQILDFKKSSSAIGVAILQQQRSRGADPPSPEPPAGRALDAVNEALLAQRRRSRPPDDLAHIEELKIVATRLHQQRAQLQRARPPPPPPAPYPPLRAVPRPQPKDTPPEYSPFKLSLPLRHLTKQDIQVLPSPRRALPPLNAEPPAAAAAAAAAPLNARNIFPASKSRSLKKKSSIVAKRRMVPARALAGAAAGYVWQRVRRTGGAASGAASGAGGGGRWARRLLLLAHELLYAYRSAASSRASCLVRLAGFTAAAAPEVRSRSHAFKVYHTGTAFYFAAESADALTAWLALLTRATLQAAPADALFSETDYSETESDDQEPEREKEKDKSKFGSLKKLTGRMQRSDSSESVAGASLDRKYLRFFSRHRARDDKNKSKPMGAPVPTEHYRSYRRAAPLPAPPPAPLPAPPAAPLHYLHASNPNLLDFEQSAFAPRPSPLAPPAPPKPQEPQPVPLLTLEEFMLQKQAEERRQLYSDRVLLGVQRRHHGSRRQLGEDGAEPPPELEPPAPAQSSLLRRNDKVHTAGDSKAPSPAPQQAQAQDSWGEGPARARLQLQRQQRQYAHLVCPPTFQAETYSLARPPHERRA